MDQAHGVTQSPDAPPRVSVVVPTVDRVALLERTLRGIAAQDGVDYEAIIVHDGDPGIVNLLAQWQDKLPLRPIQIPERGAVQKRNAGWRAATAPIIAFTDDDCEPAPGWLKAAVAAFDANPKLALVQGRVDSHPEDTDVEGVFKRVVTVNRHYLGYPNANLVYTKRALERVNGFDEAYWGAGEDADLAHRVIEDGGPVEYVDAAMVWHAVRSVDFIAHMKSLPRWANSPLTMKRHPILRPLVPYRIFWKTSHTTGFLAVIGLLLTPFNWRALSLVAPHFIRRIKKSGPKAGTQLAIADIAETAITVAGSIRYRTFFI